MADTEQDDAHGRLIDILTEALQSAGAEGITKPDVIPAVADFLTSLALIMAGEAGVRAVMTRMESRIEDWKAGNFRRQTVGRIDACEERTPALLCLFRGRILRSEGAAAVAPNPSFAPEGVHD
jgi:hypothetical protein